MSESKRFALIIWEATEEFKKEYEAAEKRFGDIYRRLDQRGFDCTYLGSLRFNLNGYPEVWLNDNMPLMVDRWCKNAKDALGYALKHGESRWWNLDILEQFVAGKGPMVVAAMWELGYRKSKLDHNKWARVTAADKEKKERPTDALWDEEHAMNYLQLSSTDEERLKPLIVLPNDNSAGLNKTFIIGVGTRGFIYAYLSVNPFFAVRTEQLDEFGAMLAARGHIAKDQVKFTIEARNVKLGDQDMVYLKAMKPEGGFTECVWPTVTPAEKIYDLAADLVSRVLVPV
ncbi:MAG: hypothetical protein PHE52_00820 [Candidatus Pacebacteria bacterium]|nr:hypothetical protein [Candidatus Paceibacterota bacterium]